ncbi:hypothetical protein AMJ49_06530 [Parcubacteria bacterium DG_74_2]|nr:MAG: hypothetical protein AMJ49_06530 [Parcubacteria bacterium DG_74_2]
MPKKKKGEEELPEEEISEEETLPEAPNLTAPETPKPDVEAQCNQIQAIVDKAKDALRAGSSFGDVIRSLAETLAEIAGAQETALGGLGMPPAPSAPEEMTPPEEETI